MSSQHAKEAAREGINAAILENMPQDIAQGHVLDPINTGAVQKLVLAGIGDGNKARMRKQRADFDKMKSSGELKGLPATYKGYVHHLYNQENAKKNKWSNHGQSFADGLREQQKLQTRFTEKKGQKLAFDVPDDWQPEGEGIDRYRESWGNDMVGPRGLKPSWNAIQKRREEQKLAKDFYPKITPQEFKKHYSKDPSAADLKNHDILHERYSRPPEYKEIRNFKALDRTYQEQNKAFEKEKEVARKSKPKPTGVWGKYKQWANSMNQKRVRRGQQKTAYTPGTLRKKVIEQGSQRYSSQQQTKKRQNKMTKMTMPGTMAR